MELTTQLHEGFVGAQLKRINRNLIITPVILLGLTLAILAFSIPTVHNRLAGPFTIDRAALLKLNAPDNDRYFVTVQADDNLNTGISHTISRDNGPEETDAVYCALTLDDRLLLVKIPPTDANLTSLVITGSLSALSTAERHEVIDHLESTSTKLKNRFLPFKLDATDDFKTNSTIVMVILGVLTLATLFAVYQWLRRALQPQSHPLMSTLHKLGDPNIVALQINQDLLSDHNGNVFLGKQWVGCKTPYGLKANTLRNVIWVYSKKVTARYYGIIPLGSRFSVLVHGRDGHAIELPFGANRKGQQASSDFVTQLSQCAPWCITGYSKELKQRWAKQRAEMISVVDQRLGQT